MTITLNTEYDVALSTALLGYVGETNARPVSVEGLAVDGADRYVLTIDYGDGTIYEVDITGGQWTPTADILRSAQTVSCQICAKKLSGDEYILVKKSRIFRLRIGAAIGDNAVPSPSVAADALDRIDAIGRQAHADMQTAVTAAETATTMANNAAKSATAAEKSADTATQVASRAETAKTAAETSATQADTAMKGAETARQQAVTAQNNAKISAAQASVSAQQTTADKNITAGYAKTAKTCADSTAADRQAVQTLATQVTADKAIVADHAAKVAEDRTAAETAAQTAQAVADSLPDDYTTAVGKIAENTAEISAVKLSEKELQRRVNALYDIGQGITHRFETDSSTAYAKTIPTGGKLMSVKNIGGRSIMWNQLVKPVPTVVTQAGVKFTFSDDGIITLNGTATTTGSAVSVQSVKNQKGHKYLMIASPLSGVYGKDQLQFSSQSYGQDSTGHGTIITNESSNEKWYYTLYVYEGVTYDNVKLQPQIYDLTAMFGSGNEPTTVEEFEKIFPADYYPYNAGEVVRTGVTEVAVGDTAYPIPEAIKALPGYGWSAGTARNYVDYENKQYVQCVQSVDLGTLSWVAGVGGKVSFQTSQVTGQKLTKNYSVPPNIICSKYSTKTQNELWGHINVTGITADANTDGYIDVNDTSYTDATAFKQAMQGVMLYYELETPIVTDISSLIPDDFLRNIEVEAKGSVTFKNSNGDDYRIPVPSEEEYIVKLSEVGGTT
ncbi:hypothetical protein [Ruminococcus sp.]|uniref:hypothetical protein n=1 Tax=Ruminococcus sp. TaxID=41978 RepID=UPI0026760C1A|nr:hypothetical protein [uncultured Ruminococcus sp.]